MTEGPLSHRLMQAYELTASRPDLAQVRFHVEAALLFARRAHRVGSMFAPPAAIVVNHESS